MSRYRWEMEHNAITNRWRVIRKHWEPSTRGLEFMPHDAYWCDGVLPNPEGCFEQCPTYVYRSERRARRRLEREQRKQERQDRRSAEREAREREHRRNQERIREEWRDA